MQLWKKSTLNRLSLAAPFSIGISSSRKGQASASPKPKSGRPVASFTETTVNTIGTMLVDDDSLSQRQIALLNTLQTTVKKIILSLLFPAIFIEVYTYTFTWNVRTGVLFALSGWFFHRWCNKLWAN